ncbi:MAG: hypothetical protein LBR82_04350, partial [Desulfovibrio sp.]|nr:hypothetical protein [Desulfovibrio sp.]
VIPAGWEGSVVQVPTCCCGSGFTTRKLDQGVKYPAFPATKKVPHFTKSDGKANGFSRWMKVAPSPPQAALLFVLCQTKKIMP